jgi:hypothetical protein
LRDKVEYMEKQVGNNMRAVMHWFEEAQADRERYEELMRRKCTR